MTKSEFNQLGKSWVDLNCWEWNDYIGEKPIGFDEMNHIDKYKYVTPIIKDIEIKIGKLATSYFWLKYKVTDYDVNDWVYWVSTKTYFDDENGNIDVFMKTYEVIE